MMSKLDNVFKRRPLPNVASLNILNLRHLHSALVDAEKLTAQSLPKLLSVLFGCKK